MTWVLHASDPHLGDAQEVLDHAKEHFEQPDLETTQRVFRRTLQGLRSYVKANGRPVAAVISGDLTYQSHPSGFKAFANLLVAATDVLPTERRNIVVVPGNHDVPWKTEPGSDARYELFCSCTRALGCTTPLLDGVDFDEKSGVLYGTHADDHHVVLNDELLVVPINSSNWCGALVQPDGVRSLDEWESALEGDPLKEVECLLRRDVARVSRSQIDALGQHLEELGVSRERHGDRRVRIAVLHHQLLPVSAKEERRAYESLINLGLVRQTLDEWGFHIVLHGHKHESQMYWDLGGSPQRDLNEPQQRRLVLSSPGHFEPGGPVMRAIKIRGPVSAATAHVTTFAGFEAGKARAVELDHQVVPIWHGDVDRREQTSIQGATANACYARLCALFELRSGAEMRNLVCRVDDASEAYTPPAGYPDIGVDDRDGWFASLVEWWQRPRSELVSRDLLGFNHGERIYRRWGNQVKRAGQILNERDGSSRAIIQLVAPRETGRYEKDERDLQRGSFPAFVVAEFSLCVRDDVQYLDCFAYFRKQEMQYWWPVNLAELSQLQSNVRAEVSSKPAPGRIVTLSAIALWTQGLPRVAVPLVDLWVEEPARLMAMAVAVAFPRHADDAAVADWRAVLGDLTGEVREGPPKVAAGIGVIRRYLAALQPAAPDKAQVSEVLEILDDLDSRYEPYVGKEELPPTAQRRVATDLARLDSVVSNALAESTQ